MMPIKKKPLAIEKSRRFLEPGPIVLVSSAHNGQRDIMTMGWHMMMEYELFGCFIWDQNHSREIIRRSKQCVINLPTFDMIKTVIGIGNIHGNELEKGVDKFEQFKLTATEATKVDAPMIAECFANFECKLIDASLIKKYSLFVFEIVAAHVATKPKYPKTVHYRGDGVFMISGESKSYRRMFKADRL